MMRMPYDCPRHLQLTLILQRGITCSWMVLLLGCSVSCPKPLRSQTIAYVDRFLTSIESRPDVVLKWSSVEPIALESHIQTPPPFDVWLKLSSGAAKRSYKSRAALIAGAREWNDEYARKLFIEFQIVQLDSFSRVQLVALLIRKLPGDRLTARYALQETVGLWREEFSDGINLHGNQPGEVMRYELQPHIWHVPNSVTTDSDHNAIELWCQRVLNHTGDWRFDEHTRKWSERTNGE